MVGSATALTTCRTRAIGFMTSRATALTGGREVTIAITLEVPLQVPHKTAWGVKADMAGDMGVP